VDEVVKLLKNSKRPLLIGGHGIRQAGAVMEFRRLMETAKIPVLLSRFGQDLLPYSHPLNFGQTGIKGTKFCQSIMKSADLVISLGCRLAIQLVGHKFDAFSPKAKIVMVDIEEAELEKAGLPIDLAVQADVKIFLEKILKKVSLISPAWEDWIQYCQGIKREHPMVLAELQRNPIDLYYFMSRLDALADERHIFVTDAGSNYYVGGQVYHFEKGQREITSGTFAAMGLSIPLAIGCAIADRKKQILAVTGDGSLELNIQELKTMSHYKLNIKLFVINNGGYVSMRNWQDGFFEGRRIDTAENTGVGTLNLEKVAAAFDLDYERIGRYEEIDDKLKIIMSHPLPIFVEVICDDKQRIVEPIKDLSHAN
jgi:acetolactate synthase-1/2/3 large subunit